MPQALGEASTYGGLAMRVIVHHLVGWYTLGADCPLLTLS